MGRPRIAANTRWWLLALEVLLAFALIIGLFIAAQEDVSEIARILLRFAGWPIAAVFALTAAQVYLSACKWAFVLRAHETHVREAQRFYFYHTATGMMLGQFLPPQIGAMTTRVISLKLRHQHSPIATGAYSSAYEQVYDIIIPLAILPASFMALTSQWSPKSWLFSACAGVLAAALLVHGAAVIIGRSTRAQHLATRLFAMVERSDMPIGMPGMISPGSTRYLIMLSGIRYTAILLRHAVVAITCGGLAIGAWHAVMLAPAIHCIALLSITPGAVGIVEWGWVGLLGHFVAAPLSVAAVFALSLRLTFVLALGLLVLLLRILPQLQSSFRS